MFDYIQVKKGESFGIKKYSDAIYRGELLNGKRNGFGVMLYKKNRVYEGEWVNDLRHGKGFERYSNGNKYEGDFEGGFGGQGVEDGEPAIGGLGHGLEAFADVGVAFGIEVKVGAKLVHEGGQVLEFLVEAPGAGDGFAAGGEAFDGFSVFIGEFVVERDALVGVDAGFADLVDLGLGEGFGAVFLGKCAWGKGQREECAEEEGGTTHG